MSRREPKYVEKKPEIKQEVVLPVVKEEVKKMAYDPNLIKVTNARDLNNLHPKVKELAEIFLTKANQLVNPQGYQIKVISTLRTLAEQKEIYAQGRTKPGKIVSNAIPGRSCHNWGVAFDVGVFQDKIYCDGGSVEQQRKAEEIHKLISNTAKSIGLFWGGDFTKPKDYPHYQYTGKYDNNTFLNLANQGKSIDDLLS